MSVKKRAINDVQKDSRREHILDTAFTLFLKKGYEKASMAQVASKAGLAKGTVYLYFKSKEELFLALKMREYDKWFNEIKQSLQMLPLADSKEALINGFTQAVCKSFKNRVSMIRLIVSLHHIFERNIDKRTLIDFHQFIGGHLLETGSVLEQKLVFLHQGQGPQILLYIKSLVVGLYYSAEPAELLRKYSQHSDPKLELFQMDFLEQLAIALSALLKGL